jgi:hypothetical protein
MIMELTIVLVLFGVIFLVGFVTGTRFEELNLRARERQLAAERRDARERADAEAVRQRVDAVRQR